MLNSTQPAPLFKITLNITVLISLIDWASGFIKCFNEYSVEVFLIPLWSYNCRRSGETGEKNSRKRLAVVCGSHRKCCDLQPAPHHAFVKWRTHTINAWIGSPVTVDPCRLATGSWQHASFFSSVLFSCLHGHLS